MLTNGNRIHKTYISMLRTSSKSKIYVNVSAVNCFQIQVGSVMDRGIGDRKNEVEKFVSTIGLFPDINIASSPSTSPSFPHIP